MTREEIAAIDKACKEQHISHGARTSTFTINRKNSLFSYGQAQKWVNMTLKYFYIFDDTILNGVESQLHVPVDRIVIKAAKEELGIEMPEIPWSKWDYDSYSKFQSQMVSIKISVTIHHFNKDEY